MTDPRMTTTDAPVTVERLRAQLQAKIRAGFCAEDTEDGDVNFCGECHWCLHILSETRLAALASAPAPSWSETPKHIRDHLALLAEVELHLTSTRVFVTTREKMHPCGVKLHDELLGKVTAAIKTIGKGQAHG